MVSLGAITAAEEATGDEVEGVKDVEGEGDVVALEILRPDLSF